MNSLDDFMNSNTGKFDDQEGGDKLWKRFEGRLRKPTNNGFPGWRNWMKAAAVFLLGVLTATIYFMNNNSEDHQKREGIVRAVTLADLAPQYAEVEAYYIKTIADRVSDVQRYDLDQYPESQDFMTHYQRVDSIYKDLMTEMTQKGADQRIIDELILNYKIKIRILEALKKQLDTQGVGQNKKPGDPKGV